LRWEDIDLEARTAVLRGTRSTGGSYRERTIGLSARAIEILRKLSPQTSGPVFANRADSVSRNFRAACERVSTAAQKSVSGAARFSARRVGRGGRERSTPSWRRSERAAAAALFLMQP
jgi:integrase